MYCRFKHLAFLSLALLCLGTTANASIKAGSLIKFEDGPGNTGGGEFGVKKAAPGSVVEFVTFCLEKNEYLNFHDIFEVTDISTYADGGGRGGPRPDPISEQTAWLYFKFRHGTLGGYLGDTASANAFQKAVWALEQEYNPANLSGLAKHFYDTANLEALAYDSGNNANYKGVMGTAVSNVRVMNIVYVTGNKEGEKGQSQLFLIPEPATMTVWGTLAATGLFFGRRRRKNS